MYGREIDPRMLTRRKKRREKRKKEEGNEK
jgi:hypothetical protein